MPELVGDWPAAALDAVEALRRDLDETHDRMRTAVCELDGLAYADLDETERACLVAAVRILGGVAER